MRSVLQCVVQCCRVLQGRAASCSVLQCVVQCCSVLQCVVQCCRVLQGRAACCSVLQGVVVQMWHYSFQHRSSQKGKGNVAGRAVCCSVLQCVAVCCKVLSFKCVDPHASTGQAKRQRKCLHGGYGVRSCDSMKHNEQHVDTLPWVSFILWIQAREAVTESSTHCITHCNTQHTHSLWAVHLGCTSAGSRD